MTAGTVRVIEERNHFISPRVLVDDLAEFENCLTILPVLTDADDRALHLHMAAYWAERCARVVRDVDAAAGAEWVVVAEVCRAVAATLRGFVLPGDAAWMGDPRWDELAAGEYDRATVLRNLHAAVAHMLPAGAARVLERVSASEPVTVEAARRAWILTPANSPKKDTAWADLYLLVVGPPPPDSVPLPVVTA